MIFTVPVPPACVEKAAEHYKLDPALLYSVIIVEHGKNGVAIQNDNGTLDLGVMQINTVWLPELHKRYGISARELAQRPCLNVEAGAYILSRQLRETGSVWKGVGYYHSRTYRLSKRYAMKVRHIYYAIKRQWKRLYHSNNNIAMT